VPRPRPEPAIEQTGGSTGSPADAGPASAPADVELVPLGTRVRTIPPAPPADEPPAGAEVETAEPGTWSEPETWPESTAWSAPEAWGEPKVEPEPEAAPVVRENRPPYVLPDAQTDEWVSVPAPPSPPLVVPARPPELSPSDEWEPSSGTWDGPTAVTESLTAAGPAASDPQPGALGPSAGQPAVMGQPVIGPPPATGHLAAGQPAAGQLASGQPALAAPPTPTGPTPTGPSPTGPTPAGPPPNVQPPTGPAPSGQPAVTAPAAPPPAPAAKPADTGDTAPLPPVTDEYRGRRRATRHRARRVSPRWVVVAGVVVVLLAAVTVPFLVPDPAVTPADYESGPPSPSVSATSAAQPSASEPPTPQAGLPVIVAPSVSPTPEPWTLTLEAESVANNALGGGAVKRGGVVDFIGDWRNRGQDGWLEFRGITVPDPGQYRLRVFHRYEAYCGCQPRRLEVWVNGTLVTTWTFTEAEPGVREVPVTLGAGGNTIRLTHPRSASPAIDRIEITRP